jgi:HJR/Mrr/RecB family endonuclease
MNALKEAKILYVDDHGFAADDFLLNAKEFGIYNLVCTSNFSAAFEVIQRNAINVLISDFSLRLNSNSIEDNWVDQVRYTNKDLKIILLSRYSIDENIRVILKEKQISIYSHHEFRGNLPRILADEIELNKSQQVFNYKNELIVDLSPDRSLFLPEQNKIITDFRSVNKSYLDLLKKNPHSMYGLTPREFEEFTAEMFEKLGYSVTLTKETHDGGKDLMILRSSILGNFLIYTECKRNSPDRPVGVRVVRELLGSITADGATAGVIVTSSYFSPEAITFTEQVKHKMSLIDFNGLNTFLTKL